MTKDYFWALATLVVAIILAIFLLMITRNSPSEGETQLYAGVPLDATLLPLDRRALDEAYHAHLLLLFSVWLKDQAGDPTRFNNGMRTARRAYHEALQKIEARQEQLEKSR